MTSLIHALKTISNRKVVLGALACLLPLVPSYASVTDIGYSNGNTQRSYLFYHEGANFVFRPCQSGTVFGSDTEASKMICKNDLGSEHVLDPREVAAIDAPMILASKIMAPPVPVTSSEVAHLAKTKAWIVQNCVPRVQDVTCDQPPLVPNQCGNVSNDIIADYCNSKKSLEAKQKKFEQDSAKFGPILADYQALDRSFFNKLALSDLYLTLQLTEGEKNIANFYAGALEDQYFDPSPAMSRALTEKLSALPHHATFGECTLDVILIGARDGQVTSTHYGVKGKAGNVVIGDANRLVVTQDSRVAVVGWSDSLMIFQECKPPVKLSGLRAY